ncbi:LDOC1-related like protein, partial [Aduncisulcus paluster]
MIFQQQALVKEGIEEFQRYCSTPFKRHSDPRSVSSDSRKRRTFGNPRHTKKPVDLSKVECYKCHEYGHFARDCPSTKGSDSKKNHKFKSLSTTKPTTDAERPILQVQPIDEKGHNIGEKQAALLDSGATTSFINSDLVDKLMLSHFVPLKRTNSKIELGDGRMIESSCQITLRLRIAPVTTCESIIIHQDFTVIPMTSASEDIIFGFPAIKEKGLLNVLQEDQEPISDDFEEDDGEKTSDNPKDTIVEHLKSRILPMIDAYKETIAQRTKPEAEVEPFKILIKEGEKFTLSTSRRASPADRAFLEKEIAELCKKGIISRSKSPFYSPIVIVPKKNGSKRLCVDFRALNEITIPFRFPLPRIDDALEGLAGSS